MKICGFEIGLNCPFFLIAGPCVIENEELTLSIAEQLKKITQKLGINFIYKASFTKANRTSRSGYRGVDVEEGMKILSLVKKQLQIPVLTDVHDDTPIEEVASVVDALQTPAFLCRQTNFIQRVAKQGLPVNIKKGQFLSPYEAKNVVEKARATGNQQVMICERGFTFGYNNLVVDMRSLVIMRNAECPVIFDVGHSVQKPGGGGSFTEGESKFIAPLARAGIATGISGLFIETHPCPEKALCDGPNSMPLDRMEELLALLKEEDALVKRNLFLEEKF
jgi:2-dehydro-3-deoxyphosphooctonate aldolase (KDO 8-P synthase)